MKKILSILLCLAVLLSLAVAVSAANVEKKYTFSDYKAGTQYAKNEKHVLDDVITITTNDAHFTSELRLYDSSNNDGTAVIQSANVLDKIVLNAGNKAGTLKVYASKDGSTWTLLKDLTTTSSYKDYPVTIGEANGYTYLKLDAVGAQIRVKYMTITYIDNDHTHDSSVTGSDANGHWTECSCGENKSAVSAHDYKNHICSVCGYIGNPTTVEEILKCAYDLPAGATIPGKKTLTGKIIKVDTAWSSQYNNITVTIEVEGLEDYPIQCYRLASGKADASKLLVGDTITVTGEITKFYETVEFKQGCTLDAHTPHTHDWTEADCLTAKTCTICKSTEGKALGHNEVVDKAVDATCTESGLTEGSHCDRCDKVLVAQETVPANGHADDDANFICDVCEAELCTDHALTKIPAKEATTKAEGNTEYFVCDKCGEWFSDAEGTTKIADRASVIIPKLVAYNVLMDSVKDGDTIVIYSPALKEVMTSISHTYEGYSYTKVELDGAKATVKGDTISYDSAVTFTVKVNSDKTISFVTANGKYLYADGTDVKLVSKAGDNTKFVLEEAKGGYNIKCATATYNDAAQYLEVYSGYFTCYRMQESSAENYVFQFYSANPDNPKSGDSISVFVALMAVSVVGAAVVLKKKEF